MKILTITLTLLVLLGQSCTSKNEPDYDKEAIELNNRAAELSFNKPDSALILYDKALKIDKNVDAAYSGKTNIYISKGDFEKAIETTEKLIQIKPDLAEGIVMLGMLYDYTAQEAKAEDQYLKAQQIFERRLEDSDKFKQANEVNRAHVLFLLGNKIEGQKEIENLKKKYPDDFTIDMLVGFNKKEYLNQLFGKK